MARVNDRILVAVAVLVTAALCISGMNMMLDSSGKEQNIYISVSADIEDEIRDLFEGFQTYTHSKLHISAHATPSFLGSTDVIMTSQPMSADELATAGIPADDIGGKTMFTPSGTKVHVFYDMRTNAGIVGALMNWAFAIKQDLFVLVSKDIYSEALEFFREYEASTNIKVNVVPADTLSFSGNADMIMTSKDLDPASLGEGVGEKTIIKPDGSFVNLFFKKEAQAAADHLIGWIFEKRESIRVIIHAPFGDPMSLFFASFEDATNVTITYDCVPEAPPLAFGEDTQIIISKNLPNFPMDVERIIIHTETGTAFIYYPQGNAAAAQALIDWLPGIKDCACVIISPDLEETMMPLYENSPIRVTITMDPYFCGITDAIISSEIILNSCMVGPGANSEDDILHSIYVTPDGQKVHVYTVKGWVDDAGLLDGLTPYVEEKEKIRVLITLSRYDEMKGYFDEFEALGNVEFVVTTVNGNPELIFNGTYDIIITGPAVTPIYGHVTFSFGGPPIIIHYKNDLSGMPLQFIEWIEEQAVG